MYVYCLCDCVHACMVYVCRIYNIILLYGIITEVITFSVIIMVC